MNMEFADNILNSIQFDEDETEILLSGRSFDAVTPGLKCKAEILGPDKRPVAIPRNLKILFESGKI